MATFWSSYRLLVPVTEDANGELLPLQQFLSTAQMELLILVTTSQIQNVVVWKTRNEFMILDSA